MKRGVTVIEILVVVAIVAIIFGIFNGDYNTRHADPELISTNEKSGQQTWKVSKDRLGEFQNTHKEFKTVSMTGITEPIGDSSHTVAFVVIIELLPNTPPEKEGEKQP
jgi:prepilin-type N-terminal cleavage/methylation domain-containing protein